MKKVVLVLIGLFFAVQLSARVTGYEKSIELYSGPGLNDLSKYQLGISMINGYRINNHLFIGVGAGFRFQESRYMLSYGPGVKYDHDYREERYIIPLFARIKANLTPTSVSPFFIADIGGNIDVGLVEDKTIQGIFIEPQFGIDIDLADFTSLSISVGPNFANTKYLLFDFYDYSHTEIKSFASSLVFHFGIKF